MGDEYVEGTRVYLQPKGMLLDAIHDLVELQKGRKLVTDSPHGTVRFTVSMYGSKWELYFIVTDIGKNRCRVQLEVDGEEVGRKKLVNRQFALLDSMLLEMAHVEIEEIEEQHKEDCNET